MKFSHIIISFAALNGAASSVYAKETSEASSVVGDGHIRWVCSSLSADVKHRQMCMLYEDCHLLLLCLCNISDTNTFHHIPLSNIHNTVRLVPMNLSVVNLLKLTLRPRSPMILVVNLPRLAKAKVVNLLKLKLRPKLRKQREILKKPTRLPLPRLLRLPRSKSVIKTHILIE